MSGQLLFTWALLHYIFNVNGNRFCITALFSYCYTVQYEFLNTCRRAYEIYRLDLVIIPLTLRTLLPNISATSGAPTLSPSLLTPTDDYNIFTILCHTRLLCYYLRRRISLMQALKHYSCNLTAVKDRFTIILLRIFPS